jgi:undecaprenyl pyrophosphate synthase
MEDIEKVEVLWSGVKTELQTIEKISKTKNVTIYIRDLTNMESLVSVLGSKIVLSREFLESAKQALSNKNYNWRTFIQEVGNAGARSAVIKLTADSLRAGLQPKLTKAAIDCAEGVSPIDVDVLLRLNAIRG